MGNLAACNVSIGFYGHSQITLSPVDGVKKQFFVTAVLLGLVEFLHIDIWR